MELLTVIFHPGVAIKAPDRIAEDLGQAYDRAYGSRATRHTLELPNTLIILLTWGKPTLGWPSWYQDEHGTLATVGLPLLKCVPGSSSEMLTPQSLARSICQASETASSGDLGYCGGYFAAAAVDTTQTVRLVTNYLGEIPLYKAAKDGVTVWSNKAAAAAMLAGLKPELDPKAAREFILLSHCLNSRTFWAGVEAEPPATCILLNKQLCSHKPYLSLPKAYFSHPAPLADTAREVVEAMGPLVHALQQSDEDVRIHLTGGQDSRAVASIFRHHGSHPLCLTHGTPNEEVASAKRLAKYVGMPYRTVDGTVPSFESFQELAQQSVWQSDGLMSLKYLAGRYDQTYIRDERYTPIEGLGGEYGRAYYFGKEESATALENRSFEPVLSKALGGREEWWPNTDDLASIRDDISASLNHSLTAGLDPYQASTYYYVNQKMRRWATARRNIGWRWVIDPLQMPCWTYRGMSAAPQDQQDNRLIRGIIETAWPGTTQVPTVPQLAYAARKRRIASNRVVRITMRLYDHFRRPMPPHSQTLTLQQHQIALANLIHQADEALHRVIEPNVAIGWLETQPWSYLQTEMFWHTLTLAVWSSEFLGKSAAISPCFALDKVSGQAR